MQAAKFAFVDEFKGARIRQEHSRLLSSPAPLAAAQATLRVGTKAMRRRRGAGRFFLIVTVYNFYRNADIEVKVSSMLKNYSGDMMIPCNSTATKRSLP